MTKSEVQLLAKSYREMSTTLTGLLDAIDKNIDNLEALPVNATEEQLQEISNNEKKILEAWSEFMKSTITQQEKVLLLVTGETKKN